MKITTLTELLTPEQLVEVEKILLNSTPDKLTGDLKTYFQSISVELEKKGVMADYLAYVITHGYNENMRHNSALN